jgi:hypothetical protein
MKLRYRGLWSGAAAWAISMMLIVPVRAQSDQKQTSTAPMSVKAGEIAQNPSAYYGKKVSVQAEVEDLLGPQVFLLDEDRLFAWPDVLVIAPKLGTPVEEDTMVTVTGTVRSYVDADLRRDYAWNWWDGMDPDIEVSFRNRPVIVADSIKSAAGTELVRR